MRHIRAADVDLQHVRVAVGELGHDLAVILVAMAGHIGDDGRTDLLKLGQIIDQVMVDTRILQTDRVEIAGRAFSGTRAGIALPRHRGNTLGTYRAELADIIEPAHGGILEGAGSSAHRILPRNTGHLGGVLPFMVLIQIDVISIVCGHDHSPHPNCSREKTGPSEQTLSLPSTVSMVHSTQVP